MSVSEVPFILSATFDRATRNANRAELSGIRRAFRRALRAADNGDVRPTVLLTYRYP